MTFVEKLKNFCSQMSDASEVLEYIDGYWFDEDAYPDDVRQAYLRIQEEIKEEKRAERAAA